MSTSGKYGERQSWRRAESGEAGKRRTIKAVLTIVATVLILLFLYIIIRPRPDQHLVTVLVSNEYNTNVITPPLFGENARRSLKDRLAAVDLRGDSAFIRSSFQELDTVAKYLDDPDDTVMVVLRGYLMQDAAGHPALACSDLSIGPTPDQTAGLLPLSKILEPLASKMPRSFQGTRLVVLDVEPLAAHPATGQWGDEVFAKLDETLKQLPSPQANRLWVIVTRGPMQNVGWDHTTQMPLSTQTLLEGFDSLADLDQDYKIDLSELCSFISDRYERLPRNQETETPRLMLLQGGKGIVNARALSSGELDVWIARAEPKPETPEDGAPAEEPQSVTEEIADKISLRHQPALQITPVALQASSTSDQPTDAAASQPADSQSADSQSADSQSTGSQSTGSQPAGSQPAGSGAADSSPASDAAKQDDAVANDTTPLAASAEVTFWDLRDELESIPLADSGNGQFVSAVSLAPHLWRQLIVKVLGGQIKDFDPQSPTATPQQAAGDLMQLQRVVKGQDLTKNISDDVVLKLKGLVDEHLAKRQTTRTDRRLRSADSLQHAVVVARSRLWAWLEFQQQAAICGTQVPDQRLYSPTVAAERVLAGGSGSLTPDQGTLDRQLADLHNAITLFDRNVEGSVKQLLDGFALADPPRTWELTRSAWAWLRSPLPTGPQRRQLLAAITAAPLDETDVVDREIDRSTVVFAVPKASPRGNQWVADCRSTLAQFEQPRIAGTEATGNQAWSELLEKGRGQPLEFADQFAAALRLNPRFNLDPVDPALIIHSIEALPKVRNPSVTLLGADGQALGDSATMRLETMQSVGTVKLRINPDRDRQTVLLVSFNIRGGSSFGDPPVDVSWKVPGATEKRAGEPITITIDPEQQRDLDLEIRPTGLAKSGEQLVLELQVRGDRQSDEIEGISGTHLLPIELPRENRLRLVASSFRGIGCSKEVISDDGGLPGGLWLRTFNERKTPFQLKLFNESGKACLAKVWLVKLPNPMPDDITAYWPDFAANQYSNPEGGVLDAEGRIQDRYLQPNLILKGPSVMPIPADKQSIALNFSPPPPADGSTAAPVASPADSQESREIDVSHGIALVCRLVDQDGNIMPENDQVIYLAAKPWAPKNYVTAKVNYKDGEVEVDAELIRLIDGDSIPDELPEIEKRPVVVAWVQDEQWEDFVPETTEPPTDRRMRLRQQAGETVGYIRVPVLRRRSDSWVRLDVDGWPRAIQHVVEHQPGSVGEAKIRNEVRFGSIGLTRRPVGNETPPPTTYYAPDDTVHFKGNGDQLIVDIKVDFAAGVFNRISSPEVKLEVEGKTYARYQTDRMITTLATELTNDGVLTLLTSVTDLQAKLNQGQRSDDRIPIAATLSVRDVEQDSALLNAVLDSTAPDSIAISPKTFGPYYAPANVVFAITARDAGGDASGIERLVIGLDTKSDGEIDTQRKTLNFDPNSGDAVVPVGDSTFKFQASGDYAVVVTAIDAAGNETTKQYAIALQKPKPGTTDGDGKTAPQPKIGRLHGVIDTRANLYGTLSISPAPRGVNRKEKDISGTDKSFDFGPLPEGKYTLEFKGFKNGQSVEPMSWKELDIDTTAAKSKPLALDLNDAETE